MIHEFGKKPKICRLNRPRPPHSTVKPASGSRRARAAKSRGYLDINRTAEAAAGIGAAYLPIFVCVLQVVRLRRPTHTFDAADVYAHGEICLPFIESSIDRNSDAFARNREYPTGLVAQLNDLRGRMTAASAKAAARFAKRGRLPSRERLGLLLDVGDTISGALRLRWVFARKQ
jgi:hypothetical protein